jgi:hypothetical protein
MPDNFRSKELKLKRGNVRARTSGDMTAVVWKDKRNMLHQQKVTFAMRVEMP